MHIISTFRDISISCWMSSEEVTEDLCLELLHGGKEENTGIGF